MNEPARIIVGTRGSPLALAQTKLVMGKLEKAYPRTACVLCRFVTEGDKKLDWSLEKSGGKGLFTSELEQALLDGAIDVAVHSGKDLPTEMRSGLCIAGCLPRGRPNDVLVKRVGLPDGAPARIATGSPRRRSQAIKLFPNAEFIEIRGNIHTRLQKIVDGFADATFLAAAGLDRLGISEFDGLEFSEIDIAEIVPAAAQASIALQCRNGSKALFSNMCCQDTTHAFNIERAFLEALGEGCHTSFAVHYTRGRLLVFRDDIGFREFEFVAGDSRSAIKQKVLSILKELNLK